MRGQDGGQALFSMAFIVMGMNVRFLRFASLTQG
jgi:hypothetical protein